MDYVKIDLVPPGDIIDDIFVFDNWDNSSIFFSMRQEIFALDNMAKFLIDIGLAKDKGKVRVSPGDQYHEICDYELPNFIVNLALVNSIYEGDLCFKNGGLICPSHVAKMIEEKDENLVSSQITPLYYKSQVDPPCGISSSHFGEKPIHWKAAKGLPIDDYTHFNIADDFGFTPLHDAVQSGYMFAVDKLIELGADVNALTLHGLSPVEIAIKNDDVNILNILIENGGMPNGQDLIRLIFKSKSGNCMDDWVDKLIDPDERESENEETFLMKSIQMRNVLLAKKLLSKGADPNARRLGMHEVTPLGLAIEGEDESMVQELISAGADPNMSVLARCNSSPLYRAATSNTAGFEIVKILLESGADAHSKNEKGELEIVGLRRRSRWANNRYDDVIGLIEEYMEKKALS